MPPGVTISPIGARTPATLNTPVSISPNVSISRTSAPVSNIRPGPAALQLPKQPLPLPPGAAAAVKQAPASAAKKVIDVVDLSDDEDGGGASSPATTVARPVTTVAYTYGTQVTTAGGQTRQILLAPAGGGQVRAGNYLVPVSQGPAGIQRQVMMPAGAAGHRPLTLQRLTHPAPPPDVTSQSPFVNGKRPPSQPVLKINCQAGGIVLSWDIKPTNLDHSPTKCYQIYAYQENSNQPATSALWKKVGDVKALPLPMACTLTQFSRGNRYHFAVRAEDNFKRFSLFSE